MTIEKLKRALDSIPNAGMINKARRRILIEQITRLMNGGG